MLKLRRGRVVSVEQVGNPARIIKLSVALEQGGEPRPALAYPGLTGPVEPGDEVIVNVEAADLGLGSGGFDILYVNHTRGVDEGGDEAAHVMKLNYTPTQHAVRPIEEGLEEVGGRLGMPVGVLALHGQLPCAAFALSRCTGGRRIGYVQTAGGGLPGWLSDTARALLDDGLVAGHVTVAPCFGGSHEAVTVEGALHAGSRRLGWEAALVAPGPGILGSASALGHGGLEALHNAHAALSVGCEVVLAPRLSSGDPRARHRGLSHHTAGVLALALRSLRVAVPSGVSAGARDGLRRALRTGPGHRAVEASVEDLLAGYRESGLPRCTMGRDIAEDEDFFRAGLAAGAVLADTIRGGDG